MTLPSDRENKANYTHQRFRGILAHPLTRGLNLDDPATTELRREIIKSKGLLRQVYEQWYTIIRDALPNGGPVLELGSGGGFLKESINDLITSEVFYCQHVALIANALALPFARASLGAIVMVDVLHHIPDVSQFFRHAEYCLRTNGLLLMIEPWVSRWSRFIYTKFHHEPFRPYATAWSFPSTGPVSGANGALPWILFERDRAVFEREFPEFEVSTIHPMMPFQYLASGGVSMRSLAPGWTSSAWKLLESALRPWMKDWGMFAFIVLRRRHRTDGV